MKTPTSINGLRLPNPNTTTRYYRDVLPIDVYYLQCWWEAWQRVKRMPGMTNVKRTHWLREVLPAGLIDVALQSRSPIEKWMSRWEAAQMHATLQHIQHSTKAWAALTDPVCIESGRRASIVIKERQARAQGVRAARLRKYALNKAAKKRKTT